MTSVRVLSNLAWARAQTRAPAVLAFNRPDYDTPQGGQWWVYYADGGVRANDRSGGVSTVLRWGFTLLCVGRTQEQCANVVDEADALFIGVSLDGNDYTSCLYPDNTDAPILPEPGDPMGPRFSCNRHYYLNTRS